MNINQRDIQKILKKLGKDSSIENVQKIHDIICGTGFSFSNCTMTELRSEVEDVCSWNS
jgi:hypothetical protein